MRKKYYFIIASIVLLMFIASVFLFLTKKQQGIKHIFLITIDTLRADHLSCYGYPRKTTPFIDSLTQNGVVFKNAYSNASTTAIAHSSIFTGYYPFVHGVLKNWIKLDNKFTTIAERLKKEGFETFAFTSMELFKACNLYQGFDYYDEPVDAKQKWGKKYKEAGLTLKSIKKYFTINKIKTDKKLFIWIHLFDPHRPYYPPERYLKIIKGYKDKEKMIKYWQNIHMIDPAVYKGEVFQHREKEEFYKTQPNYYRDWAAEDIMYDQINLYDAEIMYVDDVLSKIYKYFEKTEINKNSLWVITGDHGDGLGNHNWFMHAKHIYRELIHIPLVFYSPMIKRNKVVKNTVEHTDILPTILDFLKIKRKKRLNGTSLKKLILKDKEIPKKYSLAQREVYKPRPNLKKVPPFYVYEHGDKFSIMTNYFHFIYNTTGKEEFFNIKKDPYEVKNLVSRFKNKKITYKFFLLKKIKKLKRTNKKIKASRKQIERIKSLGYVE